MHKEVTGVAGYCEVYLFIDRYYTDILFSYIFISEMRINITNLGRLRWFLKKKALLEFGVLESYVFKFNYWLPIKKMIKEVFICSDSGRVDM